MTGQKFDRLRRTLLLGALSLATPLFAQDTTMAEIRPELLYSMNVTAQNTFANVQVNGAPLVLHSTLDEILFDTGITDFLQPGQNVITVDIEPFDTEKRSYTPHEGVAIQISVDRRSNALAEGAAVSQSVHLYSGRYDARLNTMVQGDTSVFGQGELVRQDGGLTAPGEAVITPGFIQYGNGTSGEFAVRISIPFFVDDTPMPSPVWSESPALEDTPELRKELWNAYADIHAVVASGNVAAYRDRLAPLYGHLALTTGYADAIAFGDAVLPQSPMTGPPGGRLSPLPPAMAASTSPLEFGADYRLVRFLPDPITFENANGQLVAQRGLFFCRGSDGQLGVCHIMDIPYP